ncbi:MAG: ATP-binding cassette domain-containing protein [Clostridia bacterium]|nr:ATP-binding cassette domain-containing protein [Clostridia bacterium]
MIEIKNLSKIYRKSKVKALDNVSLIVGKGIFGLLGNNGAGKTTLMNILTTLADFTEGEVYIKGIKLEEKNYTLLREMIGYMPQESGGYPNLSARDTLDYFGILNGLTTVERKNKTCDLLDYLNLEKHVNKKFKNLSGGMKRRLSLGIALISDPEILIVDEPTTGVDPNERIKMRNLLLKLGEEKTIILSTHIIEDVSYICERLAILFEGKRKYEGDIKNLMEEVGRKTWEIEVNNEKRLKQIIEENLVAGIVRGHRKSKVKIISHEKPYGEAVLVEPTLEDAYIAIERMW